MSYSDQDYQTLAKAIVEDFVQQAVPLEDGVVKQASASSMNAYETRRLLEATNLNAHLILFEKMAEHKYVEFDVVDPESVCAKLFASPEPVQQDGDVFGKVASLNLELPDERWEKLSYATAEKLAAAAFPELAPDPEPAPYGGDRLHHAIQLSDKVAEELLMGALTAHQHYTDKVAAFARHFTFLTAMPFADFEKDAYALAEPAVADAILAKTREFNSMLPEMFVEKTASGRYVIERAEHTMFREVVAAYDMALELAEGYAWFARKAEPLLQ